MYINLQKNHSTNNKRKIIPQLFLKFLYKFLFFSAMLFQHWTDKDGFAYLDQVTTADDDMLAASSFYNQVI